MRILHRALSVAVVLVLAGPVWARPRIELDVALDPDARRVIGTARIQITNTADVPVGNVPLWLYPNFLAHRPAALGDIDFHRFYPGFFSPAGIEVQGVRADGRDLAVALEDSSAGPHTIARVTLLGRVAPGGSIEIDIRFETTIPRRFGAFGCHRRRCRLMGGYHPMPAALGPGGFRLDVPPPVVDVRQSVTAPSGFSVEATGAAAAVPYPTIVAAPRFETARGAASGFDILLLHDKPRPPATDGVLPYVREDRWGRVLEAVQRGLDRVVPPSSARSRLLLVEAPLRHEICRAHGGTVLVSDEIYRLLPADRLRRYHTFDLLRCVYAAAAWQRLAGREADGDLEIAADFVATQHLDAFARAESKGLESARAWLRPFDFIPAVDQLVQAPIVASSSTYFRDIDERGSIVDDPRAIAGSWPRGRFVHQKLVDLVGPAAVEDIAGRMLDAGTPLRTAAAEVFGSDLAWFWAQWLGPPKMVNYRIASVATSARNDGRPGASVAIEIAREGEAVREPVEIRVVDRAGRMRDLVWREPGRTGRFVLELESPLASVEIDPRGRLQEAPVGSIRAEDDPLVDNRRPGRWRFLYQGFGALLDVTRLQANFFAAFTLKRAHDLGNAFGLYAFHSETTQIGAGATAARFFGRKADANRRSGEVYGGIAADLLDPSFGAASRDAPGWRASAFAGVGSDDRDFLFDPWRARGYAFGFGYTLTSLDDGSRLSHLTASAGLLRLVELAPGQVLAGLVDAGASFARDQDLRHPSQLVRAGGPSGLRGYTADELLGRWRGLARLELRSQLVSDLSWNLLHLTFVRALGLSLFAEAAAVSPCDGYGLRRGDLFYDVGVGFHALHDAFGVHQQRFAVDVAVPLVRRDRSCFEPPGTPIEARGRPPFLVYVSFLPSF